MEEISWGQRLLGFDTPAFFHKNSYQDEANIHNLLTGPVDVWTKTALTYAVASGLLIYGDIFPITLRLHFKPALWLAKYRIAAEPPLSLMLAFIAAAILEIEPFGFNEAEVAELLVAWALAFTALSHWQSYSNPTKTSLLPYLITVLIAALAVWNTTTALLNAPEQRKEIDQRLANGYEKFAERYEGYNYTVGVVSMLEHYDQLRPNNTVILRRIVDNLNDLGETEAAQVFLKRAISEGLRRVNKESDNIQANISLAKSYRKLADYANMSLYANKAYNAALAQYKDEPDNAYWAYWLAKACEQTNRQQDALHYYRKAHQLDPASERYEQAYEQKKEIMLDYEEEP
jgi:tetratricopeptide (TPR) repeat protein